METVKKEREIPILFRTKAECCGCTACLNVCPVRAITMEEDEEGFRYPKIDAQRCIRCGRCAGVCDFRQSMEKNAANPDNPVPDGLEVLGMKNRDAALRARSRSGGVFGAVSQYVLNQGGVVYGCVMENCKTAVHVRAENADQRDRMHGSKYVQSDLRETFSQVKADAQSGRLVLFTGTPCQIAGLRRFLGINQKNVILGELVCYGVSSPKVWKDYVSWWETRQGSPCTQVDFRDKSFGWEQHWESLWFGEGQKHSARIYAKLFGEKNTLRPSCFVCPYKRIARPGDFTMGDFWSVHTAAPELYDAGGVSLVLVNTPAGKRVIEAVRERFDTVQTDMPSVMHHTFREPLPKPESRERFWRDYQKLSFDAIARKYGGFGMKAALRRKLAGLKRRLHPGKMQGERKGSTEK